MGNSQKKRDLNQVQVNAAFKLSPIAAGCAALIFGAVGSAHAQVAEPAATGDQSTSTQQVTVVGIRKGIEDAISVKKNSQDIVEAISAEDIGKLPDTTIAESLARLPGLTTQRDSNGNATTISIRGLGPDFNGYLLNGREQTSTNDSRAVDLSVYPAELIAGATVYKTNDVAVVGQGLAGTIDQNLVDPLAFAKRVAAAEYQKTKNGTGLENQGTGKRYALTYIDQFADRKVGIAIGYVHQDSDSGQFEYSTWGDYTGNVTDTNGNTVSARVPGGGGFQPETLTNTDKRDGLAAILEFKPNKNFKSQLDTFYSKIDTYQKIDEIQAGGTGNFTNATISGGIVTSATMNNVDLIDRQEAIFTHDKIKSVGWRNTFKTDDGWTIVGDLSHNSAQRIQPDDEYYGQLAGKNSLMLTNLTGMIPGMSYGASLTDPNTMAVRNMCGWSGITNTVNPSPTCSSVPQAGYSKGPNIVDTVTSYRIDFMHDMPEGTMFTDYKFGMNYTDRTKDRNGFEGLIVSATGNGYDPIPFPSNSTVAGNVGGTGLSMLSFMPQVSLIPGAAFLPKYNNDILSKSWDVDEKVTTTYGKLDIDTKLGDLPVHGNVGAQLVHTDQSSSGFLAGVGSTPVLANPSPAGMSTNGTTYNDFLPSLNLNGDLGNDTVLRLALGKQIARPDMTDMRGSFSFSPTTVTTGTTTTTVFSGSAGNPNLKPFRADALDLSLEKYFAKKGYISGAVFYKKLDSYIVPQISIIDFSPYLSSVGYSPLPNNVGVLTQTVNGSGGNLKGYELSASVPFNLASKWLDGFGAFGSYSSTTSSVQLPNIIGLNPDQNPLPGSIGLPGLSKENAKLTLYYEKNGFSAFVADNYRSRYIGSVTNSTVGGYPTLQYIESQRWVSAQIGYEIQDGYMKGLAIRLEGNNLNRPWYQQTNFDGSINMRTQTGGTVFLSVNYKLQ
ncbi:MAG: TonB-dependent receptor [Burkholderiaceae bacterium]|nr:TonB-dependent receptor [Burkholderiaceae bacterium]